MLTRLDEAGLAGAAASSATDEVVARAVAECRGRERFGSLNFFLSDPSPSRRAHAVFVASEAMTDETWTEVPNGALLRIDRDPPVIKNGLEGACSTRRFPARAVHARTTH